MGPWIKRSDGDDWKIEDESGQVIATVETEKLADVLLAGLTGLYPAPPDYPEGEPVGEGD